MRARWSWFFLPLLAGCGARTGLSTESAGVACAAAPPICVQSASNPCDAPTTSAPTCDASAKQWVCPPGARVYARAAPSPGACLPFRATPGLASVGAWGLGSMARVPTDDGRCLWVADSAKLSDGTIARNVAFTADVDAPFGACPDTSVMPPTPIVTLEGGDDPNVLVQIDGGYRLAGATHVLYRLFRVDASSAFGVTEMGGGVGRWDPTTKRILIPKPGPFPWGLDLDLGDASIVADGSHAFVFGCAQPGQLLLGGCELARLDDSDAVELFSKGGTWIASTDASQGATLFGSGPWTSSVVATSSGFRHVYVAGFGTTIQSHVAASVTGPWSAGPDLAACDLPPGDPKAFCAGPIVHLELADPTRPNELPIGYGVGTTGTPSPNPDDSWTRLIWTN